MSEIHASENQESSEGYGQVWVVSSPRCNLSTETTGVAPVTTVGDELAHQDTHSAHPVGPKKPSKPLPAPRRSLGRVASDSSGMSSQTKENTFPGTSDLGYTKYSESTFQSNSKEPGKCVNIDTGCGQSVSTEPGKHMEASSQPASFPFVSLERAGDAKRNVTSERGIKDLCVASLVSTFQVTQPLTDQVDGSDMKKFHRNRSNKKSLDTVDGAKFEQIQGTYRRISDDESVVIPKDEDVYAKVELRKKDEYGVDKLKSQIDDDLCYSEDCENQSNSPGSWKRGHHRLPSYENWTIDRCVTRHDDSNESQSDGDDPYDNVSFSGSSPSSTLQKFSYKGSKDSGLCDDLSTTESSPSVCDSATSDQIDSTLTDGGIDCLKSHALLETLEDDGGDDNSESADSDDNKNGDNVSIASDIIFIPASKLDQAHLLEEAESDPSIQDQSIHIEEPQQKLSPVVKRIQMCESPIPSSGDEEVASNESYDETDTGTLELSPRDKMLKMRQLLVKGVLDSEKTYLTNLELLLHYKRSLEASSHSSQPVIAPEDIEAIFFNISTLYSIHLEFVQELEPELKLSAHEQRIGEIFKLLIFKFPEFGKYMENYQQAVSTIHRCAQESQRFQELAGKVTFSSSAKEITNLEDALFKPVQRVQRNTLVLHDLIKYTPSDHSDYKVLQKTLNLSQHNLENFSSTINNKCGLPEEKHHLVKSSFLVELIGGTRKLRYIFLFNNFLVCTKKENSRRGSTYICKWFIPLSQLGCSTTFDYQDDQKFSWREDIEEMKRKIGVMKADLRAEIKKEENSNKHWSISGMASARNVEKLKKKIQELQAQMILASPKLPFKLSSDGGKTHTLLMTTDYEREEWRETITSLCRKSARLEGPSFSTYEIQELVNSVKELPQVNKLGSVLMQKDEEILTGTLNVTIHKLNRLEKCCDTYCCLEMDSFEHFFMKARTHICQSSADPSWDEDFELELNGSQTLRFLCYEKVQHKSDKLLGRGAMELSKSWLRSNFQEKTIAMNEVSLVISVRHTPADKTMRRTPSQQKTAVFGIKITTCTRREGKTVPSVVTACIQEVEKRGLDEVGIYRVSGVTSEVQKLKKTFDKSVRAGSNVVGDTDIHAVTGILKLYFRELPEPLFTEVNYQSFLDTLKLSDIEAKEKCMLSLLHNLPDANYYTIVTLLEHLLRVSKNSKENKMSIHNLSTVFGPTLLAPAAKETTANPLEMMSKGAEEVLLQSGVINYFLQLMSQGRSLRRSAPC